MSDNDSELELELDANKAMAIGKNDNIRGLAFNMDLIRKKDPALAREIEKNVEEAMKISPDDEPKGTDEEVAQALAKFDEMLRKHSSEQ